MNDTTELNDQDQRFTRWLILRMLYACRPGAASGTIMLRVLHSLNFDCAPADLSHAIDYMCSAGLAEARRDDLAGWRAHLTALGVAVVEYNAQAPSGIARPRRWRGSKR
jgi:hypothetical protein